MKNKLSLLFLALCAALPLQGQVLLQDSTNYPYTNGTIEGQGQWYCYTSTNPYKDAMVTNNVLLLTTNGHDSVATPTNGWSNNSEFTFASFEINVTTLPTGGGNYFCQFVNNGASNRCCNVFVDAEDTALPGTYRLGIANYSTSFGSAYAPINYPMDLAPGVNYTVVILFDTNPNSETFAGASLWVNPSEQDWINAENNDVIAPNYGEGYVYATDTPITGNPPDFTITQIAFEPYVAAGISNVIAGAMFENVNTTNLPVVGIQPQSQTNYSGNNATFFTVASGIDATYQWYSQNYGILSDGPNISGATSNVLAINNIIAADGYYAVITDAYGKTTNTAIATNTVITAATAPFFPASVVATNATNTVFTTVTFNDTALGTGPLSYQWYFAPTNLPTTFSQLNGDTNPILTLTLNDYTAQGQYYVVVTSAVNGGSAAYGPTNSLVETAPINGSLAQLYALELSMTNQLLAAPSTTITINSNNVTVSGYVSTYGGFGSSYSEFFLQNGPYGIEVYLGGHGNTNTPPIGTYVTVTGEIVIYHAALEIEPTSITAIVPGAAPVVPLTPQLGNFKSLTSAPLSTNSLLMADSLVTFTNVYIYTNKTGAPVPPGMTFFANGYTALYFTVGGPYSASNTNVMEIYQYGYNYPNTFPASTPGIYSPFYNQPIPSHCYQLTGVYNPYAGSPELEPSRLADYVTTAPSDYVTSITKANNGTTTITWPVQTGVTYSVFTSTNLVGPWIQSAYGLNYYPANGIFTDTNKASAKFYQVTTP